MSPLPTTAAARQLPPPNGESTPGVMIGDPNPLVADATPAAGTSDKALPPKTTNALAHLDNKWTGLFKQCLADRRVQQEAQRVQEEMRHAEDNRQHANNDRRRNQEAASLPTLEEIMTAALALLTSAVNTTVNLFEADIKATVEEIKATITELDT